MAKPVVPDAGRVGQKWVRRSGAATGEYVDGATRTQKSQSANARAAKQLWVQQVTAPASHDRWEKGLLAAGDDGWRKGVTEKGGNRYGPGVQASEGKFTGRLTGILSAIAAVEIPMRSLPASAQNYQRSQMIGQALNKLRGTFAR